MVCQKCIQFFPVLREHYRFLKRAVNEENLYYADEEIDKVKELAEKEILIYDQIKRIVKFQTRLDELAAKELFENASR